MQQPTGSPDPTTHPAPEPGYDDDPDLAPDPLHEPGAEPERPDA